MLNLLIHRVTRRLNTHKTETNLFSKRCSSPFPHSIQNHNTFLPRATAARYLSLLLDSKLLYPRHLHNAVNKATGSLFNISLLAADPTLAKSNKLTLYKLLILSFLTNAAPVCTFTHPSNYLKFPAVQSVSPSHRYVFQTSRHFPLATGVPRGVVWGV
jgi:hypothetical protein